MRLNWVISLILVLVVAQFNRFLYEPIKQVSKCVARSFSCVFVIEREDLVRLSFKINQNASQDIIQRNVPNSSDSRLIHHVCVRSLSFKSIYAKIPKQFLAQEEVPERSQKHKSVFRIQQFHCQFN